jgi:outer membrane protein OmpA-like peptidoglycan-associated protein
MLGGYWTHIGPGDWYIDAVAQGTFYNGKTSTITGTQANLGGNAFTGSLEAGYPIPIWAGWRIEPQAQAIFQHLSINNTNDQIGSIDFNTRNAYTFRGGARLQDSITLSDGTVLQPYAKVNVWYTAGATDQLLFGGADLISVNHDSASVEVGGGLVAKISPHFGLWVTASYNTSIDNQRQHVWGGTAGLRYTFGGGPPLSKPPPVTPAPVASRSYLVFFDWDKATLTDRARQIIREAAENSTHVQYTRIDVNGYTDTSGTPKYNQGLSVRRAQAVAAELVRDGVSQNIISVQGFGDTHLLVPTGRTAEQAS